MQPHFEQHFAQLRHFVNNNHYNLRILHNVCDIHNLHNLDIHIGNSMNDNVYKSGSYIYVFGISYGNDMSVHVCVLNDVYGLSDVYVPNDLNDVYVLSDHAYDPDDVYVPSDHDIYDPN